MSRTPTVSPSRLNAVLACPKQARLKEEGGREPPGDPALIGSLVHKVLEVAALKPCWADKDYLSGILAANKGRHRKAIVQAAGKILKAAAPVDLTRTTADLAEVRFSGVEVGPYLGRGIIDRIDLSTTAAGGQLVHVVDYKTGQPQQREELARAPQTLIYLEHAVSEYFNGSPPQPSDDVAMIYDYVGSGVRVRIDYDPFVVEEGLAAAGLLYEEFQATPTEELAETPNPSCSWCSFRSECSEFKRVVEKPASPPAWAAGLPLGDLVAKRYQVSQDIRLLELARKDLDVAIKDQIEDGRYEDADHTVRTTRRKTTTYSPTVLPQLSRHLGVPLLDLVRKTCKVSNTKVKALAKGDAASADILALHASTEPGSAFLTVKARGGLF